MRITPRQLAGALLLTMLSLAGCDSEPAPRVATPLTAPQEATLQAGDTAIRASVVQTSALNNAVARQYGIERDDEIVMLLVGLRQGPAAEETSVAATVTATVTDLRGQKQVIEMRELHSGELVDYVGTVAVSLPDTLAFELSIAREGKPTSTMQFSREFFPQ
ncbi:MAG: DUF4426 domain-containing protein [Lysobacter sp.]